MWSNESHADPLDREEEAEDSRRRHLQRLIELQEELDKLPAMPRRSSGRRAASPTINSSRAPPNQRSDAVPPTSFPPSTSQSHSIHSYPSAVNSNQYSNTPAANVHDELRSLAPFLSSSFQCSDNDALMLVSLLSSAGSSASVADRLAAVECDKRNLEGKLERKIDECEKLKDEVGEVRQKLRAVQQQASQTAGLLSQKREEVRKQLVLEEGRTQKLQHQNKLLQQELDKLKTRVHSLMK